MLAFSFCIQKIPDVNDTIDFSMAESTHPFNPPSNIQRDYLSQISRIMYQHADIIIILLSCIIFLVNLGGNGLWDPWETHYAQVAREMIIRDNYVYPHWESSYFFSKPILQFWYMALSFQIFHINPHIGSFEFVEWAARLPFALTAIIGVYGSFVLLKKIFDVSIAFASSVILLSSPQFIYLGKQAMPDILFGVYTALTILFVVLLIKYYIENSDNLLAIPSLLSKTATSILVLAISIPQYYILAKDSEYGQILLVLCLFPIMILFWIWKNPSQFKIFYTLMCVLISLAILAKGIIGLALPAAVFFLYMLMTQNWKLLMFFRPLQGFLIISSLAFPWFIILSLSHLKDDEGNTFFERFFIHDHFDRLAEGVHGDRGSFSYYIEQFAFAFFPWISLVPFIITYFKKYSFSSIKKNNDTLLVFFIIWACFAYVFYSLVVTKFHHYIFPVIFPMSVMIAVSFSKENFDTHKESLLFAITFIVAIILLNHDIINHPRYFLDLFTYNYQRPYPSELSPDYIVIILCVFFAISIISIFLFVRKFQILRISFFLFAIAFSMFHSHINFSRLSPHWSSKHLLETYHEQRKPSDILVAYQMNWRGETFYSNNTVIQLKGNEASRQIYQLARKTKRLFIITEQERYKKLQKAIGAPYSDRLKIIDSSNNKFYLLKLE